MEVHTGTAQSFPVHDLLVPLQGSNLENWNQQQSVIWCIGVRLWPNNNMETNHTPGRSITRNGFTPIKLYAISKFFTAVANLGTQNLIAEVYKHLSATLTASVVVAGYQLL